MPSVCGQMKTEMYSLRGELNTVKTHEQQSHVNIWTNLVKKTLSKRNAPKDAARQLLYTYE